MCVRVCHLFLNTCSGVREIYAFFRGFHSLPLYYGTWLEQKVETKRRKHKEPTAGLCDGLLLVLCRCLSLHLSVVKNTFRRCFFFFLGID